jgi:hypothetical protein
MEKRRFSSPNHPNWRQWVAAGLITVGITILSGYHKKILSGTPFFPEIVQKQEEVSDFIKTRLLEWDRFETPESKEIIDKAFTQLDRLDRDGKRLQDEFNRTGNRFVLDALIENARQKTELLQQTKRQLIKIEKAKRYENQSHSL